MASIHLVSQEPVLSGLHYRVIIPDSPLLLLCRACLGTDCFFGGLRQIVRLFDLFIEQMFDLRVVKGYNGSER